LSYVPSLRRFLFYHRNSIFSQQAVLDYSGGLLRGARDQGREASLTRPSPHPLISRFAPEKVVRSGPTFYNADDPWAS